MAKASNKYGESESKDATTESIDSSFPSSSTTTDTGFIDTASPAFLFEAAIISFEALCGFSNADDGVDMNVINEPPRTEKPKKKFFLLQHSSIYRCLQ